MTSTTKGLLLGAALTVFGFAAHAEGFIPNLPRNETLIIENPEGTIRNAGWFNVWSLGGGGMSTGMHQLATDTLWYIDPEQGLDGVWENSLAADKPIYNADFTEMTVKLRKGIYWSDNVEFTADDVVYTVEAAIKDTTSFNGAMMSIAVESVKALDPYTVVFKLKKPNSRFHTMFCVRWNATWIMPKHVFEKYPEPFKYDFNKPVSLGAYVLHSYDPNGKWYIWEKRQDWQRTTLGLHGEPAPKYVAYVDPGPSEKRVIAQLNHNLDIIHDVAPEGMFTLARESKTSRGWFKAFPYAHPDPTLPAIIFNAQVEQFKNRDLRWALALATDIKAISMASYRGAATISPLAIPPTGSALKDYFNPLQAWLKDFELDTGKEKIKPYDDTIGMQIADMVRATKKQDIPTDPEEIRKSFGTGWWKFNPKAAAELMEKAGYTKKGGKWMRPDGTPFEIKLMTEGDARSVMTRAASMIAQQWTTFGVPTKIVTAPSAFWDRNYAGDYEVTLAWSVETWGGHPDLSYFLDSWHSQFIAPPGKIQPRRNIQRYSSPELDSMIEEIRKMDFNDPKGIEVGRDYAKLMVREMPIIPLMSYNVFTVMDETYWTGYPTAENPYSNPVPNWANSRSMMVKLKPVQK